jgi:hypothetical protein
MIKMIKFKIYAYDKNDDNKNILIHPTKINFVDEYTSELENISYRRIWMATNRVYLINVCESFMEIYKKVGILQKITDFKLDKKHYLINTDQIRSVEEINDTCCRILFLSNMQVIDLNMSIEDIEQKLKTRR